VTGEINIASQAVLKKPDAPASNVPEKRINPLGAVNTSMRSGNVGIANANDKK